MARLLDTLRAERTFQMPNWVAPWLRPKWEKHLRNVAPLLGNPDLPVLLLDNVSDYFYHGTDQEHFDIREDFPNLAPPFPVFWAEHRMPTHIHSKEKGTTDVAGFLGTHGRVGMLMHALEPENINDGDNAELPEGTRWILWGELFIDYGMNKHDKPFGPHDSVFFCIDKEGRLLDRPWAQSYMRAEDAEMAKMLITWYNPTLLAISFLHCRNVQIVDHAMDKPLAKKWREKTGQSPTRYKTLIIEPLKQILRHEGGAGKGGNTLAKAMHICRGHFRDYREGRGLFGKYNQLVWTPQVVRGTHGKKVQPREMDIKV